MKAIITITLSGNTDEFRKEIGEFTANIDSGIFQQKMQYHSQADLENPKVKPFCKCTATYTVEDDAMEELKRIFAEEERKAKEADRFFVPEEEIRYRKEQMKLAVKYSQRRK